eukprot:14680316-Ditylum_brightwellii.AAC.1
MPTNKPLLNMTNPKPPTVAALVPTLPAAAVACVGQYISPVQWLQYKIPEPPNITTLPYIVVELVENHIVLQLNDLVKVKKLHWKGNIKMAFSKRQYIYGK